MSSVAELIDQMTPEEKELMRKKLMEEQPYHGDSFTIFFPEEMELHPLDIIGPVPRKGEMIAVGKYGLSDTNPQYDFTDKRRWVVTDVVRVVTVPDNDKMRLYMDNTYRTEVMVAPYRPKKRSMLPPKRQRVFARTGTQVVTVFR